MYMYTCIYRMCIVNPGSAKPRILAAWTLPRAAVAAVLGRTPGGRFRGLRVSVLAATLWEGSPRYVEPGRFLKPPQEYGKSWRFGRSFLRRFAMDLLIFWIQTFCLGTWTLRDGLGPTVLMKVKCLVPHELQNQPQTHPYLEGLWKGPWFFSPVIVRE